MRAAKPLILLIITTIGINLPAVALSKEQALQTITAWQNSNVIKLKDVDSRLENGFLKSSANEGDLKPMVELRQELMLRQNFYDRLKLQIDSHYNGQNFKIFLPIVLKDMALLDAKSAEEPALWPFMNQLALTIETTVNDDETALPVIEGVINKSSLRKASPAPSAPKDFSRDYDNGRDHARADSVDREDIGEIVEQKLEPEIKIKTDPKADQNLDPNYEQESVQQTGKKISNITD